MFKLRGLQIEGKQARYDPPVLDLSWTQRSMGLEKISLSTAENLHLSWSTCRTLASNVKLCLEDPHRLGLVNHVLFLINDLAGGLHEDAFGCGPGWEGLKEACHGRLKAKRLNG